MPEGQNIPTEKLLDVVRLVIDTTLALSPAPASTYQAPTSAPQAPTQAQQAARNDFAERDRQLTLRGSLVQKEGKYKHKTMYEAYTDHNYRKWVLDNIGNRSSPGMRALKEYFQEMERHHQQATMWNPSGSMAYMALDQADNSCNHVEENHLIAILDTGCNQTCHGENWLRRYTHATGQSLPYLDGTSVRNMRGIGGNIATNGQRDIRILLELLDGNLAEGTLRSTELKESDAPLLLSIQAQKALGLIINLASEVVHSEALGKDLKLVVKDGLLGLRLLPSDVDGQDHRTSHHFNDQDDGEVRVYYGDNTTAEFHHMAGTIVNKNDPIDEHDVASEEAYQTEMDVGFLALDELKGQALTRGKATRVDEGIDNVKRKDQAMWNQLSKENIRGKKARRHSLLPRGCRTFLLEIFAGAAVLSHMALQDYHMPVSAPIDLRNGQDLLKPEERRRVEDIIERDDPYAITFAPVCGPWSQWTNILTGESWDKVVEERKKWTPVVKWIFDIIRKRLARGRQVLLENPWGSHMWDLKEASKILENPPMDAGTLEDFEAVRVDQCMPGLKDKQNGLAHYKPTAFATATKEVKQRLCRARCDGQHAHQPLEGGNRTRHAAEYPPELCKEIIDGFIDSVDAQHCRTAFPAEAVAEDSDNEDDHDLFDAIYDENDYGTANHTGGIEQRRREEGQEMAQEEERPPVNEHEESESLRARRRAWRQLPYETRVALRRLHHMTGHSPPAAMQRLLRTAGADKQAIMGLCEAQAKPKPAPAVKMPGNYKFNEEVSVDVFIVKDITGACFKVMSLVDTGTLFHVAAVVGEGQGPPASSECASVFRRAWLNWAGTPTTVVMDRGSENKGRFRSTLSEAGILLRYTGTEAPHQLGRGERQGGILKDIVKASIQSRQLRGRNDIETLVIEAATIKNNRLNNNGFTPSQWVLGRLPEELDSVLRSNPRDQLGLHQDIVDGQTEIAKQMIIRQAAREAYAKLDSSQRVRAPTRGPFVSGDLVCFHRKQGSSPYGKWHGPARVIGQEGRSTLWLLRGGVPLTVSAEACRRATGDEALAKRQLELRPSRKRRREEAEQEDDDLDYPYGDDLVRVAASDEQRNYFDDQADGVHGGHEAPILSAPPGLPAPAPTQAAGGLPPITEDPNEMPEEDHLAVPVPADDFDVQVSGSVAEPEQEMPIETQEVATNENATTTSTPSSLPTALAPTPTPTALQQAMYRSIGNLDGHSMRASRPGPYV